MINTKMADDLIALGIKKDDTVLMHSSLKSLGYVEGGAETVIDTLMSVLHEGTLLIPALSHRTVTLDNPVFYEDETPSCVGAISEYFRTRPGVFEAYIQPILFAVLARMHRRYSDVIWKPIHLLVSCHRLHSLRSTTGRC